MAASPFASRSPSMTVASPNTLRLKRELQTGHLALLPLQGREFFYRQFPTAGPVGADLLMAMCSLDPRNRITAVEALRHHWWTIDPRPTRNEDLPQKQKSGAKKMGDDLSRRGGQIDDGPFKNAARQLDFGAMK
ncbi:hypothetical protein N7470_001126 [Penicillium chermesinum]|nr:hypothetical protein N7470_001126 [Penicillium chermesinum]